MIINNYKGKISRLSDKIFDNITSFFQGSNSISPFNDNGPVEIIIPESNEKATYEWDLNQGTADILINDMSFIYNHLFPERLINALHKLYRQVQIYFLLDEVEILPEKRKALPVIKKIKAKMIVITGISVNRIQQRTLSMMTWNKLCKAGLLRMKKERSGKPTYYLLGDFHTSHSEMTMNHGIKISKNPDNINFSLPFFHYLRN